ncbi:PDZ domain-containing protein [Pedobacter aquatilis]|uniref:M61 family metallopeptidase n=1 Tax=Pedobacter aquatilis TaxID=351343 RepID=UPI002930EA93|nr:PDZ domain-containing protein [Pedobacter aquatilis]
MDFIVSMEHPEKGIYQVELTCSGLSSSQTDLKIPVWMPGYYQIMNYANDIQDLKIKDLTEHDVKWERANHNTWRVYNGTVSSLKITYNVKTTRSFVATNYLTADYGFIASTGMFLHVANKINTPVTVQLKPASGWTKVATGLTKIIEKPFTYTAADFDILYDSPILIGKLDELPVFKVRGVPHYFIGYKLGDFDKTSFIADLKKVVDAAVNVIGDIPFNDYTFIGIGPGRGGIEHINSSAVSFSGSKELNTADGRKVVLSFLGHEYFHHYNAKRIRPIELGPFDYDNGSKTNMLWVAEGVTTYYDEMLLRWAGLESSEEIFKNFSNTIKSYETSPGRYFQTVSQASYDTWSDGPFGRKDDEVNKTISYYEKGPILAMMLDLKIRNETKNVKSLDDVMRKLYYDFYKKLNRGYTEAEFRSVCENIAGTKLDEFFSYVYTLTTPDYNKYFNYAGLAVDLSPKPVPGGWLGINAGVKNESLVVRDVEWMSPAWNEGVRRNNVILKINSQQATVETLDAITKNYKDGDIVKLEISRPDGNIEVPVILGTKMKTSFEIKRKPNLSPLQQVIQKSWLKE